MLTTRAYPVMKISKSIKIPLSFISSLSILITSFSFTSFAENNKTETVIFPEPSETIEVSPSDSIQEAFNKAKDNTENEYTEVILQKGETYYIDLPLFIYSNTVVQAEGAMIERTYNKNDQGTGIIRNRAKDGTTGYNNKIGGYDVTKNVYINGGIWSGGNLPDNVVSSTNIIFCHADNINLLNAEFKNNFQNHLVEFNAVSNSLVQNCSFDGLKKSNTSASYMAFQIDIAHSYDTCKRNDGEHINCPDHDSIPSGYYPDNTACKNIRILSNSWGTKKTDFGNFDTACGSDKTLTDGAGPVSNPGEPIYHEDINISYNTINGCLNTSIASRGHKNVTIKGNTITNSMGKGIIIKRSLGGIVTDNTITDTNDTAILLFEKSTLPDGNKNKKITFLNSIDNNKIIRAKKHGISVEDESRADSITDNSITDADGHAVSISGKSQVLKNISRNIIKCPKQNGIFIYDNSKVGSIDKNNISSPAGNAIALSKDSCISDKISLNTITKSSSYGILIYDKSLSKSIENNSISDTGKHGIGLYKSSADSISGNIISNAKQHGIVLSTNSKTTGNIENNTISQSGKNGIFIYNNSSSALIKNNKISVSKANGISLSTGSSVSEIINNTISNSANFAIVLNGKSKTNKVLGNKFSNNAVNCKASKDSQIVQNDCIPVKTTKAKTADKKTIKPEIKKIKSFKVKSKKKKTISASWKKLNNINGYFIEYSLNKNFKVSKSKKLNKKSKSCTIKKLKSKKKYYIRIRAYKKYSVNGKTKTAFGPYSVKKIKIR